MPRTQQKGSIVGESKIAPQNGASTQVDRAYEKHFHNHYDDVRSSDQQ
jgi:hypothetical protein